MTCKYLEGAIPSPGSSLDNGPCVIRDGRSAIVRNDDGEEECASCARTAEQMGGDWLVESMDSDFTPDSVAYGLREDEFDDLSPNVRCKLVRLMARIAERSYRRGFQHGVVLGDKACIDPGELRFQRSLDESPYTDQPGGGFTSVERLFMECGALNMLGFVDDDR